MSGQYSRAVPNQEWVMIAHVQYIEKKSLFVLL